MVFLTFQYNKDVIILNHNLFLQETIIILPIQEAMFSESILFSSFWIDERLFRVRISISEALLETTCSDAVGSLEDRSEPADLDPSKDSPLVRLGSKRRKLVLGKADKGSISYGASIQSAFTHAASDRRFR